MTDPDLTRHCVHCEARLVDGRDGSERSLCPACGYCTHPSQSGRGGFWVCNACDARLEPLRVEEGDPRPAEFLKRHAKESN